MNVRSIVSYGVGGVRSWHAMQFRKDTKSRNWNAGITYAMQKIELSLQRCQRRFMLVLLHDIISGLC